jgi:antitoxin (DNA-binding transcriptional repressor) of toxin-antitoxin stability system
MSGERIEVLRRGKVIAPLIPKRANKALKELLTLVEEGLASWSSGKPSGSFQPIEYAVNLSWS